MDIQDLAQWQMPQRIPVPGCARTRIETRKFVEQGLNLCLDMCMAVRPQSHTAALLRTSIDFLLTLHRQHSAEPMAWHYKVSDGAINHVIPVPMARELLLDRGISLDQVFDLPVVRGRISDSQHAWLIFAHHNGDSIKTQSGVTIPAETWTLADHFEMLRP